MPAVPPTISAEEVFRSLGAGMSVAMVSSLLLVVPRAVPIPSVATAEGRPAPRPG